MASRLEVNIFLKQAQHAPYRGPKENRSLGPLVSDVVVGHMVSCEHRLHMS